LIFLSVIWPVVLIAQDFKSDSIVAIINDEIITYGEVLNKIKESFAGIENSNLSREQKEAKKQELFKITLRRLVDEKLTLQEAKRYNIKVSEETIKEHIQKEFAKEGKTIDMGEVDLTDLMRSRLTLQELFQKKSQYSREENRRATIDTYVAPSEIREFYKKNILQFTKENKIKTRIITLFYSKCGGREQCLAKAEALVKELRKGADFAEMARLYSHDPYAKEGGTWPRVEREEKAVWDFFGKGELYSEVDDIIFSINPGEISDPIPLDAQQYCHIVKVEEVQVGGVVPFAEVQDAIHQRLRNEKVIAAVTRMLYRLRQKAFLWPPNLFQD
jgi:peptidyl-prolyl cis-trans isomerase C